MALTIGLRAVYFGFMVASLTRRLCVLGGLTLLTGCQLIRSGAESSSSDVVAVAGWTRVAETAKYLVVANVLPGERMFTAAEYASEHPLQGELIIAGSGRPLGANVRHVEAHIYDKATGVPITDVKPTIVVINQTTGEHLEVGSTLMQDVNIGRLDIHFGNNIALAGASDLRLVITIGDEEVTIDGHLD